MKPASLEALGSQGPAATRAESIRRTISQTLTWAIVATTAKPLKTCRIQVLAMRRNHLGGASGPPLADILTGNNTLRRLDLRQNELRVCRTPGRTAQRCAPGT